MKPENFRVNSKGLPMLRDLRPGTYFYFNNTNLVKHLCMKTGDRSPQGKEHKEVAGAGFGIVTSSGTHGPLMGHWYLANAKVIQIGSTRAITKPYPAPKIPYAHLRKAVE